MHRFIGFYRNLFEENRHWIKLVTNWFLLAAFVGGIVFFIKPEILQTILGSFAERFGDDPALDFNLVIQIFIQNLTASAIALFGGLILGLGPFFVVVVNGFLLGFVIMSIFALGANLLSSLIIILGGLTLHGIFEIPAFLFSAVLGLRLGIEWMTKSAEGNRAQVFKQNLIRTLKYIPFIALALIIAAIIEVFVSGKIVDNL